MNSDDKAHAQALVRRLLGEARDHATAGAFHEALAAVRKARGLDPSNVFILAFERQIEQIQEHLASGTLSDDQRRDIIDSLAGIVQSATSETEAPAPSAESAAQPEPVPEQREQVRAARQWLKNQYLQRAHSHVLKKEYDKALSEIRRVFIIDERDRFAREFEMKVLQMQELGRRKTLVFSEDGLEKEAGAAAHAAPAATPATPPAAVPEPPAVPSPAAPPASRSGLFLRIGIIATVALLAFAFYYFWKREQPRPVKITPAEEQTAPTNEADEPIYRIPPGGADSTHADSTANTVPQ